MDAICDLPIEMRLEILEKLKLHELVVNSSKTCHQWRDDIAQHILAPKILALAEVNEKFKMEINSGVTSGFFLGGPEIKNPKFPGGPEAKITT